MMNKKDKQLLNEAYTTITNEWFGLNKKPKINPEELTKDPDYSKPSFPHATSPMERIPRLISGPYGKYEGIFGKIPDKFIKISPEGFVFQRFPIAGEWGPNTVIYYTKKTKEPVDQNESIPLEYNPKTSIFTSDNQYKTIP